MWYKNAIIYSLDVETFMDSNGDGVGDFRGLIDRIDHLETLGVTCVWLQPFFPSPNRDDGYDVTDYYTVDPRHGTLGDFAEFTHALKDRGIRLIIDLVVNHTSDQHPWFREACRDPDSPYRDYYIWSKEKPPHADQGMVFPGQQESTWTWNEEAGAHYFHRFFAHQPDLNIANPAVRREILRVMGLWLQLGVAGFRVDAAPFLIELTDRSAPQGDAMYAFLCEMHDFLSYRTGDGILLAEANVAPDKIGAYFGGGDRMHMLFNFLVNQPMFLALARRKAQPLLEALKGVPDISGQCQWAMFLRNHDELDLGRLPDDERQEVYAAFGPDPCMQVFGRGIRRRLAPMFGGDRRREEMAHSLTFSLPGSQVIRYGDEIGMGDDLSLEGRDAVRTPMQWSDEVNAGFSAAPPHKLVRPVIAEGPFAYDRVNARAQLDEAGSLVNKLARLIRVRRGCPEIGWGETVLVDTGHPAVLGHLCRWEERAVFALHNLGEEECSVTLGAGFPEGRRLVDLIGDRKYPPAGRTVDLAGYGYRWFRLDRENDGGRHAA